MQPSRKASRPLQPSEYISVAQAAALLSVSEKLIRKLIKNGEIQEYRVGRLVRMKREELINYILS